MLKDKAMSTLDANVSIKKLKRFKLHPSAEETRPDKQSLEDFVKLFVKDWSLKYPTLYSHSGDVQTPAGRRRSLGDITRVCQSYYENVSLEKVKNILKDLVNNNEISVDICDATRKRVYFFRTTKAQTIDECELRDEFGWRFNLKKKTLLPKRSTLNLA